MTANCAVRVLFLLRPLLAQWWFRMRQTRGPSSQRKNRHRRVVFTVPLKRGDVSKRLMGVAWSKTRS